MIHSKFYPIIVFVFLLLGGMSNISACDIIFSNGFSVYELKLVHHWRFNEVGGSILKDEACGSDAHIIEVGPSNAVVLNGSVYVGGGDKNTADYIKLPDDILSGSSYATIEIWASNESILAWSRIFDFGPSTNDFIMMSWNRFELPNTDRVQWVSLLTPGFITDDTVGNYELGTRRHIVMTIEDLIPGVVGRVYWYVDGVYKGLGTMNSTLAELGKSHNYLARSKFPDPTANARYHEVNIYNGIMTDDVVIQRFLQGPDDSVNFTATTFYPGNNRYYLFSGTQYYRQDDFLDSGYPRSIFANWDGWTPSWGNGGLDAIAYNSNDSKYYLFWNNEFIRHTHAVAPDSGFPKTIVGNWSGWPAQWGSGELDAVVYYPPTNKYYLFKGSEYVRHSPNSPPDAGYPRPIVGNWNGWPSQWGSGDLDALLFDTRIQKYYLFKGNEYVRHNHAQAPDVGYPLLIKDHWLLEN